MPFNSCAGTLGCFWWFALIFSSLCSSDSDELFGYAAEKAPSPNPLFERGSKVREDLFRWWAFASWLRWCRRFQCSFMAWLRASDCSFPDTNVNRDVPLEELDGWDDMISKLFCSWGGKLVGLEKEKLTRGTVGRGDHMVGSLYQIYITQQTPLKAWAQIYQ